MGTKKTQEMRDLEIITQDFYNEQAKNALIAMGKPLCRDVRENMSIEAKKIWVLALAQVHWSEWIENYNPGYGAFLNIDQELEVIIPKKVVAKALGLKIDKAGKYSKRISEICDKAFTQDQIILEDKKGNKRRMHLFLELGTNQHHVSVVFHPIVKRYLFPMDEHKKDFTTLWAPDICNFKTDYAAKLYMYLREFGQPKKTMTQTIPTKTLKEIFGLDENAFMRTTPSKRTGNCSFDRTKFEKRVLQKAIDEINESQMIQILPLGQDEKTKDVQYFWRVDKEPDGACSYHIKWAPYTQYALTEDGEVEFRQETRTDTILKKHKVDVYETEDGRFYATNLRGNKPIYEKLPIVRVADFAEVEPKTLIKMEMPVDVFEARYEGLSLIQMNYLHTGADLMVLERVFPRKNKGI